MLLISCHSSVAQVHRRCLAGFKLINAHRHCPQASHPCKMRAQSATKSDQSDAYNEKMKKAMGWKDADPYQYHYDRGLYYHEIVPDLLCGSQPRGVTDVAELKEDVGVTTVVNVGMHNCCKLVCPQS